MNVEYWEVVDKHSFHHFLGTKAECNRFILASGQRGELGLVRKKW